MRSKFTVKKKEKSLQVFRVTFRAIKQKQEEKKKLYKVLESSFPATDNIKPGKVSGFGTFGGQFGACVSCAKRSSGGRGRWALS